MDKQSREVADADASVQRHLTAATIKLEWNCV